MVKIVGSFEVNDWAHWKKMFDEHSGPREAAGIKTIYVGNELENPNKVHIVMETPAADTMQKFMEKPENAKKRERSDFACFQNLSEKKCRKLKKGKYWINLGSRGCPDWKTGINGLARSGRICRLYFG